LVDLGLGLPDVILVSCVHEQLRFLDQLVRGLCAHSLQIELLGPE
jgi:hypothetical protein